ncbi:MAG: hypothetical protein U5K30_02420 [Acidimicrobiales bacterium]|nr:hypothetical protein [Acidimicrobiales bacterium]
MESDLARHAIDRGIASEDDLRTFADALLEWGEHEDGWFIVPHGEVLARPGRSVVDGASDV